MVELPRDGEPREPLEGIAGPDAAAKPVEAVEANPDRQNFEISTKIGSSDPEHVEKVTRGAINKAEEIAGTLSTFLEERGWVAPEITINGIKMQTDTFGAIQEPIVNGVVHGNDRVGQKKEGGDLVEQTVETIIKRLDGSEPIGEQVKVICENFGDRAVITIEDQGDGFDWRNLPDPLAQENLMNGRNRGLFITFSCFGKENIKFNEKGNQIQITVKFNSELGN